MHVERTPPNVFATVQDLYEIVALFSDGILSQVNPKALILNFTLVQFLTELGSLEDAKQIHCAPLEEFPVLYRVFLAYIILFLLLFLLFLFRFLSLLLCLFLRPLFFIFIPLLFFLLFLFLGL